MAYALPSDLGRYRPFHGGEFSVKMLDSLIESQTTSRQEDVKLERVQFYCFLPKGEVVQPIVLALIYHLNL